MICVQARSVQPAGLAVLASVLLLNGCFLDRSALRTIGKLEPQQFCTGDEITASFDLLGEEAGCPTGFDCEPYLPEVSVASTPTSFPIRRVRSYRDSFSFVPAADRVDVTFSIDHSPVLIPTDRYVNGARVFVERTINQPVNTLTVRRITDILSDENIHHGMCAGANHAYTAVDLARTDLSPNIELKNVCNISGVPIILTLTDPTSTDVTDRDVVPLEVGDCHVPTRDGLTLASVRPQFRDPTANCNPVEGSFPPRPLRTQSFVGCR